MIPVFRVIMVFFKALKFLKKSYSILWPIIAMLKSPVVLTKQLIKLNYTASIILVHLVIPFLSDP